MNPHATTEVATILAEEVVETLPAANGPIKIIPKVRKCGVTHFKNRFSAEEPLYAVDVLESESPDIGPQMQDELKLRQNIPRKRTKQEKAKMRAASLAMPAPALPEESFHFRNSGRMVMLRIRIQSPAILRILSRIITNGEELWTTQPRTFIRPFSPLIFHHKSVRDCLAVLQERWGSPENLNASAGTPSSMAASEHDGSGAEVAVDDCPAALAELRAYVKFIDSEVMQSYTRFDKLEAGDGKPPAKVRFQDLWYLFRVGDLLFRPVGTGADKDLNNASLGNRTWRCYGTRPAWAKYRITPAEHKSYVGEDDSERAAFGLHCYYIDYTGDEFCAVTETFEIPPFKGEKPIKSLKIFPYRFASNHKDLYRRSIEISRSFLRSIKVRHAAYQGWTTTVTPRGIPGTDEKGNTLSRPEFIDSEVIVDFVEAFQTCPAWKPEPAVVKPVEAIPQQVDDDFAICRWSDTDRSKLIQETNEMIILRTGISAYQRNYNLSPENPLADKFLMKIWDNDRNGKLTAENNLNIDENDPQCDLPLLPSRIFAYVLRDRKFVQLVVQRLQPLKKSADAFNYLKINSRHKDIIQSLVEEHFQRKSSDREGGVDFDNIDLIRGKGKGLFILLFGVPGVGKTATAEAIAAANGKPLFPITCGDLGLTPTEVEAALLRIFRLADTWNCVLLLDEVDTFFSQRAKGDATLAKNALVSVFLRVLEYYDGLLFLTTNRPGALDEAFKSRIHLKLYYPQLSLKQTQEIWLMNIERLHRIEQERHHRKPDTKPMRIATKSIRRFAEDMYKAQKKENRAPWNGRQIRNAFQVASSLAHYDARGGGKEPKLTVEHFKTIRIVTDDFDQFMHEAIGKTDGEQAFERGERADHFVSKNVDEEEDDEEDDEDNDSENEVSRMERKRRGSLESYTEAHRPLPYGGGESSPRHRRSSFEEGLRRSVSPNVASTASRGRSGGGSNIFGVGGGKNAKRGQRIAAPPLSPRQRPQHGWRPNPAIEVTGDNNDAYLSPDQAKTLDGRDWNVAGSGKKRGRDSSAGDVQRRGKKRPKDDLDDDDESE